MSVAVCVHIAIENNDVAKLKELTTSSGTRSEAVPLLSAVFGDGFDARTPLSRAAELGHIELVRWLIDECKVDVNARDPSGGTALWFASERGYLRVVEVLKANGAGVSNEGNAGNGDDDDGADYDHAGLDFD